jgi:hypothetical protein
LSSTFVSPKLWLTPLTTNAGVLSVSFDPAEDIIVIKVLRSSSSIAAAAPASRS